MANTEPKLQKMMEAGLHLGHKKSITHPMMKPFLLGIKNDIQIINLEKTEEKLNTAIEFLKKVLKENGTIIFVGTRPSAKNATLDIAEKLKMPRITERWLGGTLTNFSTLQKRIDYFLDLLEKQKSGELEKYTKKERHIFEKQIQDLEVKFGGMRTLKKLPEAVFIVNIKHHETAVKEAKKNRIPIVAIVGTESNPNLVEYPIPASDDSRTAITFILNQIYEELIKDVKA